MNTFKASQQNFKNIQLELNPNKVLCGLDNNGVLVYEEFRDIPMFEGVYQASNFGRVKSIGRFLVLGKGYRKTEDSILKMSLNTHGYMRVALYLKRKRLTRGIHQLVAYTFLNHKACGYKKVIDHINNVKIDNSAWNLQLISNRENSSKDKKGGTSKYVGVNWAIEQGMWRSSIYFKKRILLGYFDSEKKASEYYQNALISIKNKLPIKLKRATWSSKYKGVSWCKKTSKWRAYVRFNSKRKYLGFFQTEEDAHQSVLDFKTSH